MLPDLRFYAGSCSEAAGVFKCKVRLQLGKRDLPENCQRSPSLFFPFLCPAFLCSLCFFVSLSSLSLPLCLSRIMFCTSKFRNAASWKAYLSVLGSCSVLRDYGRTNSISLYLSVFASVSCHLRGRWIRLKLIREERSGVGAKLSIRRSRNVV